MSNIPELKDILIEVLVSVLDLLGISAKFIKMKRIGELNELFRWNIWQFGPGYFRVVSKLPTYILTITAGDSN